MKDTEFYFEELKELRNNAYVPYSNFRVATILYLKNGERIVGVNVENAAYSPTICGERCALPQLYAQGYDRNDVELMTLYTDSKNVGTPCGVCRQVMIELLNRDQKILIFNINGYCEETTPELLLPKSFTEEDL
jgi:cytidine deaminase